MRTRRENDDMAMAPQQLGIGIVRRFTRPGVDPYDTVAFDKTGKTRVFASHR